MSQLKCLSFALKFGCNVHIFRLDAKSLKAYFISQGFVPIGLELSQGDIIMWSLWTSYTGLNSR